VDDGIQRSGSHSSDHSRAAVLGFSTSVPIDVPAWMGSSMNQATFNYHDDDDVSQHCSYLVEASRMQPCSIAAAWDRAFSCVCLIVCLFVHTLKGKWQDLLTPNLIDL